MERVPAALTRLETRMDTTERASVSAKTVRLLATHATCTAWAASGWAQRGASGIRGKRISSRN
ncbi:hypothetical protein KXD40_003784 [Peronospora effusa]|nr:hypothetical protein KXD40_003784 [Peronospora effusa]